MSDGFGWILVGVKRSPFPKNDSQCIFTDDPPKKMLLVARSSETEGVSSKGMLMWVFPKIGGKPLNHPFVHRVFHHFQSILGVKSPIFGSIPMCFHVLLFFGDSKCDVSMAKVNALMPGRFVTKMQWRVYDHGLHQDMFQ